MRPLHRALATVALVLAAVVSTANPAAAAPRPTIFLMIEGLPGGATDSKHKGEIQIESYSFGASNSGSHGTGGGGGAGKVVFQDLHVLKHGDAASAKLFQAVIEGKHFPKAVLTVERSRRSATPYLVVTLDEVMITAFTVGQSAPDSQSDENVTLEFGSIAFQQN